LGSGTCQFDLNVSPHHVHSSSREALVFWVVTELRWAEIDAHLAPWVHMSARNGLEEPANIEVVDASFSPIRSTLIWLDVALSGGLEQANQPQSPNIRVRRVPGEELLKVAQGQVSKSFEIAACNPLERTTGSITSAYCRPLQG